MVSFRALQAELSKIPSSPLPRCDTQEVRAHGI
jgi:hypothetical protein